MGRLKKYVTPEEEEAQRERHRVAARQRIGQLQSSHKFRAEAAAPKRKRRGEHPENRACDVEYERNRRGNDPGLRVMQNFQRQTRKSMGRMDARFHLRITEHRIRVCEEAKLTPSSTVSLAFKVE